MMVDANRWGRKRAGHVRAKAEKVQTARTKQALS
jgi:hypothetical protein